MTVARITKVEHPAGEPFAYVEAPPIAQLDQTREVLLVWRNVAEEKSTDTKPESKEKPDDTTTPATKTVENKQEIEQTGDSDE